MLVPEATRLAVTAATTAASRSNWKRRLATIYSSKRSLTKGPWVEGVGALPRNATRRSVGVVDGDQAGPGEHPARRARLLRLDSLHDDVTDPALVTVVFALHRHDGEPVQALQQRRSVLHARGSQAG